MTPYETNIEKEITEATNAEEALLKVAALLSGHRSRKAYHIRDLDEITMRAILKRKRQIDVDALNKAAASKEREDRPSFDMRCEMTLHEIAFWATKDFIGFAEGDGFSEFAFVTALENIVDAYINGKANRTKKDLIAVSYAMKAWKDSLLEREITPADAIGRYIKAAKHCDNRWI